ncbi:MAG: hypothetical protein AAGB12_02230 [Pseudomonadota bacterium]
MTTSSMRTTQIDAHDRLRLCTLPSVNLFPAGDHAVLCYYSPICSHLHASAAPQRS